MKHFLFLSISFLIFCFSYAQKKSPDYSNIITTKRIVVKNKKYATDKPSVYLIPIVSKRYPELSKTLCDINLFDGERLDSVVKEYQNEGMGISSFSYEITFINKEVVSLKLDYETMGAYPDKNQNWLTLNIYTGKKYPISNEISPNGLKWIFNNYKRLLLKRILQDKKANNGEGIDDYDLLKTSIDSLQSKELFNQYIFTTGGVVVSMEKILPHVVQVFEPDREWLIPYNKLKPYILPSAIVLNK
jgi:hypothetical protein